MLMMCLIVVYFMTILKKVFEDTDEYEYMTGDHEQHVEENNDDYQAIHLIDPNFIWVRQMANYY